MADFEIVTRAPTPPPEPAPRVPRALRVLGIAYMAAGAIHGALLLGGIMFAMLFGGIVGANGLGFFFLPWLVISVPFLMGPLFAGFGLYHGRTWARLYGYLAAIALILMGTINIFNASGGAAPLGMLPFVWYSAGYVGLGVAGIVVLTLPRYRASLAPSRGPILRSSMQPDQGSRSLHAIAAVATMILLSGLAQLPLNSLRTDADGQTLLGDSTVAAVFGSGVVLGGALLARRHGNLQTMRMLVAVGAGILVAVLLGAAAVELSRVSLRDGVARTSLYGQIATLAFGAWGIALLLAFARARPPGETMSEFAPPTLVAMGTATILHAAFVMSQAEPLASAAEARTRSETPGIGVIVLLTLVAATALLRSRSRHR